MAKAAARLHREQSRMKGLRKIRPMLATLARHEARREAVRERAA
jgi:hypothetical protein